MCLWQITQVPSLLFCSWPSPVDVNIEKMCDSNVNIEKILRRYSCRCGKWETIATLCVMFPTQRRYE